MNPSPIEGKKMMKLSIVVLLASMTAFGQDNPKPAMTFQSSAVSSITAPPPPEAAASFMNTVTADGKHEFNIHDPKNEWICRVTAFSPPPGNNVIHPNEPTSITIVCLKKEQP